MKETQFKVHPFKSPSDKTKEYGVALLGALYARRELVELIPFSSSCGGNEAFIQLSNTAQEIFETNIVALAAIARANDEGYRSLEAHTDQNPQGVGTLCEEEKTQVLTAREACNKIVHAQEATIEWVNLNEHPIYESIYKERYGEIEQDYLTPVLHLKGSKNQGKTHWQASTNLIQWVHAIVFFT